MFQSCYCLATTLSQFSMQICTNSGISAANACVQYMPSTPKPHLSIASPSKVDYRRLYFDGHFKTYSFPFIHFKCLCRAICTQTRKHFTQVFPAEIDKSISVRIGFYSLMQPGNENPTCIKRLVKCSRIAPFAKHKICIFCGSRPLAIGWRKKCFRNIKIILLLKLFSTKRNNCM